MLVGILSDTHDQYHTTVAAMRVLAAYDIGFYAHCGDVGSSRILDLLAGLPCAFVFGNNDDRTELASYAERVGIRCFGTFGHIALEGKRLAMTHGDDQRIVRRILDGQQFDYLFVGHTHVATDQRVGRTRIINPGALHRARVKSVGLLDLTRDALEILRVDA